MNEKAESAEGVGSESSAPAATEVASESGLELGRSLYRVARALTGAPADASALVADTLRTSGSADRIAAFRALRKNIARRDETPANPAWAALPPSERDALALRVAGGLTGSELVSVLGAEESEVVRRLARAIPGGPTEGPCVAAAAEWLLSGKVSEHGLDCDACRDHRYATKAKLEFSEAAIPGADDERAWKEAIDEHNRAATITAPSVGDTSAKEQPSAAPAPTAAPPAKLASPKTSNRKRTLAAIGSVVLLGGALLGYSTWRHHHPVALSAASFHVDQIGPTAGPTGEGATYTHTGAKGAEPLVAGIDVRDGVVTTGPRGFVRFSRGEGRYLLDRASTLSFDGDALHLSDGALLARDDQPVRVRAGKALVSGEGELQFTVLPDRTHVRVLRGFADVEFEGRKDRVEVGQEGLLREGHFEVASAAGPSLRLAESKEFEAERPLVGLGELIARKPGSKDERDGAVVLKRHSVKTRIAGAMARTEIEEEFENKTDEVLEGVVRFPLPPGAVLERLALEVDGKLVEGEFVERKRAAAIFRGAIQTAVAKPIQQEEIIWVPGPWRDPALLEWQRAGRFELRIFPIAKRSVRRVVMAYTEAVPMVAGERQYSYPMPRGRNLKVPSFSADVKVVGYDDRRKPRVRGYDLAERAPGQFDGHFDSFEPDGDLTVSYETPDQKAQVAAVAFAGDREGTRERWATLSLRPVLPRVKEAGSRDQVLVVDVGRGMFGERFERAKKLVAEVISNMDRRDRVTVLACDTTCKQLRAGFVPPGVAAANDVGSFLGDVRPDGASDMAAAVSAATRVSGRDAGRPLRVTLLSAGAATAGYREPSRLAKLVTEQVGEKAQVVTVAVTPDADATALEAIARAGGGVFVTYAPGRLAPEVARDILDASYGATLRNVEVVLPEGLVDVAPAKVASMRGGAETLVAARMARDEVSGDVVVRGTLGGSPFEQKYPLKLVATASDDRAFVPRVYASLRVKDVGGDPRHEQEVVKLSKQEHVPAPQTSLLVLESETMFKAFGIDRTKPSYAWDADHAADAVLGGTLEGALGGDEKSKDDAKVTGKSARASADAEDPFTPRGGGIPGGASGAGRLGSGESQNGPFAAPPAAAAPAKEPDSEAHVRPRTQPDPVNPWLDLPARPSTPEPRRRSGRWMRRTWQRSATIQEGRIALPSERELSDARRAVDLSPDVRSNYVKLARLLSRRDEDGELRAFLTKWEQKDPFDLGLLGQRAEYLLRRGDRAEALRVQAGALAAPSLGADAGAQSAMTLARAYERLGQDTEACSFWRSALELRPQDDEVASRAMQCDRRGGLHIAEDSLRGAPGRDFSKIERLATNVNYSADDTNLNGDFRVDAHWDVPRDLDIAFVLPSGERITWATKGARGRSVASTHEETLVYSKWFSGGLHVEVGPGVGAPLTRPVRGNLTIRALGQVREIPFVVDGTAKSVARIQVNVEEVLVPTAPPPPSFQNWGRQTVF